METVTLSGRETSQPPKLRDIEMRELLEISDEHPKGHLHTYPEDEHSFLKICYNGVPILLTIILYGMNIESWYLLTCRRLFKGLEIPCGGKAPRKALEETTLLREPIKKLLLARLGNCSTHLYSCVYSKRSRYYYMLIPYSDELANLVQKERPDCDIVKVNTRKMDRHFNDHLSKFAGRVACVHYAGIFGVRDLIVRSNESLHFLYERSEDKNGRTANVRVGAIPYFIERGQIFLVLAVTVGKQYSDFGGGCKTSKRETPYQGLKRELVEEAGPQNAEIILESMRRIGTTYVVQVDFQKVGDIAHYVFVMVNPRKMSTITPNEEIDHHETISYADFCVLPSHRIHVPLKNLHRHLCRPNEIIGEGSSFINPGRSFSITEPGFFYTPRCSNRKEKSAVLTDVVSKNG